MVRKKVQVTEKRRTRRNQKLEEEESKNKKTKAEEETVEQVNSEKKTLEETTAEHAITEEVEKVDEEINADTQIGDSKNEPDKIPDDSQNVNASKDSEVTQEIKIEENKCDGEKDGRNMNGTQEEENQNVDEKQEEDYDSDSEEAMDEDIESESASEEEGEDESGDEVIEKEIESDVEDEMADKEESLEKIAAIYVGGLPYTIDEEELGAFLTTKGITYKSINIVRKGTKSRGFGYIECVGDSMNKCLTMEDTNLQGKSLRFELKSLEKDQKMTTSRKSLVKAFAFLGNNLHPKKIRRILNQEDIKYVDVNITNCKCTVTLRMSEWEKLSTLEDRFYKVPLDFKLEPGTVELPHKRAIPASKVLFVKNIPNNVVNAEFKKMTFGLRVIRRKNFKGKSTGLAFLEYRSVEDATKALKVLNGRKLRECTLYAQFSEQVRRIPKKKQQEKEFKKYSFKPTDCIEINQIPINITKERLNDVFTTATDLKLFGRGKFQKAVVSFPSISHALEARRRLAGHTVDGVVFKMQYVNKQKEKPKKGKIQHLVTRTVIV